MYLSIGFSLPLCTRVSNAKTAELDSLKFEFQIIRISTQVEEDIFVPTQTGRISRCSWCIGCASARPQLHLGDWRPTVTSLMHGSTALWRRIASVTLSVS